MCCPYMNEKCQKRDASECIKCVRKDIKQRQVIKVIDMTDEFISCYFGSTYMTYAVVGEYHVVYRAKNKLTGEDFAYKVFDIRTKEITFKGL